MPAAPERVFASNDPLVDVLKLCTAAVVAGDSRGTGFFVDDDLLLTCAHVVGDYDDVVVQPYKQGAPRAGRVIERLDVNDPLGDLCLVQVAPAPEGVQQLAVLVHDTPPSATLVLAVGYPADAFDPVPAIEELEFNAHLREQNTDGALRGIVLESGKTVTPGLSGAPLFDRTLGAVVGIVRYSNDPGNVMGGGAIPMAAALERLDAVRARFRIPPRAAAEWVRVIGTDALRALGREPKGAIGVLDLELQGNSAKWQVVIDANNVELTVGDLGDDVTRALFYWAKRRQVVALDELYLLGKLLWAGLFKDEVANRFDALERVADEVVVRLHVEPDCELGEVPWEYATIGGSSAERFLGTDSKVALARVVTDDAPPLPAVGPSAPVLAIIVQPPDIEAGYVPAPAEPGGREIRWPPAAEVDSNLSKALAGGRFDVDVMLNPSFFDVEQKLKALEASENLIVHYIGMARRAGDEDKLLFSDDDQGVDWNYSLAEFAACIGERARLAVVELANWPANMREQPIAIDACAQLVHGKTGAVVATRFPVHPRQYREFNDGFYETLASGAAVEFAMQSGRARLYQRRPLGDRTIFGAFALYTNATWGLRLLSGVGSKQHGDEPDKGFRPTGGGDEHASGR